MLASRADNGQLISPALTPSDEKYPRPFDEVLQDKDGVKMNVVPTRQAGPIENGQTAPKPKGRSRSATLPSLDISPRTPVSTSYDGSADIPKLSPAQIMQLTSTPDSIPVRALTPVEEVPVLPITQHNIRDTSGRNSPALHKDWSTSAIVDSPTRASRTKTDTKSDMLVNSDPDTKRTKSSGTLLRPLLMPRSNTAPFPPNPRRHSAADRIARSSRPSERPRIVTNPAPTTDDELPKLREAAQIPEPISLPLPPF